MYLEFRDKFLRAISFKSSDKPDDRLSFFSAASFNRCSLFSSSFGFFCFFTVFLSSFKPFTFNPSIITISFEVDTDLFPPPFSS
jgi:hypothetical protein